MNITFIGFGHMAQAIARGLAHESTFKLTAASPSLKSGVSDAGLTTGQNNREAVQEADVIILAVKPAQMRCVYQEIEPYLPESALIISVAAGMRLSWFEQFNTQPRAIIRAMPNIAAAISQSATPLLANQQTAPHQKAQAQRIFSTIGLTAWADDETQMDLFTALSGSGVAYVFLFMEKIEETAIALGLPQETAHLFTLQTFNGALNLALTENKALSTLRKNVTSPNGTTAAAINSFEKHGLGNTVSEAMKSAFKRAQALSDAY